MNIDKLVKWTHYYEVLHSYSIKCIILGVYRNVFFQFRIKVFTNLGTIEYVREKDLIPIKNELS